MRCVVHVLHLPTALRSHGLTMLHCYYGGSDSCTAPVQHRRRSHSLSHDVVLFSCSPLTRSRNARLALGCAFWPPRRTHWARLRLSYAGSPSPARRTGFNACASASLGLRTPFRLLPTPPRDGAVIFRFPLFPHHHRTWTFTSYRHDLGLARSSAFQCRDPPREPSPTLGGSVHCRRTTTRRYALATLANHRMLSFPRLN